MKVASPERYVRKLRRGIADEVDYDGIAVRVAGDLLAAGSWGKSGAGRWRGAIGRPLVALEQVGASGGLPARGRRLVRELARAEPVRYVRRSGQDGVPEAVGAFAASSSSRRVSRGSERGSRSPAAGGAARGVRHVEQLVDLFDYD